MYSVGQLVPMISSYVGFLSQYLKNGEQEEAKRLIGALREAVKKEQEAGLHNEENPMEHLFSPLGPEAEAAYQALDEFTKRTMP
ncbi:MAG: hypothetical protein NTU97_04165 [Candidatus Magasanikbacteria bacterium]|nr:hypothetical protein [Candidatus Magasanikbacteria bacterium]